MKTTSAFRLITATAVAALSVATAAFAADPDSCSTVHFSDVGWTDITSTTATAAVVLKGLGYTAICSQDGKLGSHRGNTATLPSVVNILHLHLRRVDM